jgi:hypothetical protein
MVAKNPASLKLITTFGKCPCPLKRPVRALEVIGSDRLKNISVRSNMNGSLIHFNVDWVGNRVQLFEPTGDSSCFLTIQAVNADGILLRGSETGQAASHIIFSHLNEGYR